MLYAISFQEDSAGGGAEKRRGRGEGGCSEIKKLDEERHKHNSNWQLEQTYKIVVIPHNFLDPPFHLLKG